MHPHVKLSLFVLLPAQQLLLSQVSHTNRLALSMRLVCMLQLVQDLHTSIWIPAAKAVFMAARAAKVVARIRNGVPLCEYRSIPDSSSSRREHAHNFMQVTVDVTFINRNIIHLI